MSQQKCRRCQCCSPISLHPSGVAKSSTSFGWGKGGNVTSAGWQVALCDPKWHVSSHQGCICQISLGGSKFWLLKSTTVLMHRYIESRPPCVFLIAAGGSEIFAGGFNPQPPDKYSPGSHSGEVCCELLYSNLPLPLQCENQNVTFTANVGRL